MLTTPEDKKACRGVRKYFGRVRVIDEKRPFGFVVHGVLYLG